MSSDSAIDNERISKWAFTYAIFKLHSFKEYQPYTLKYSNSNTEIQNFLSEGNVSDSQKILIDSNWQKNFNLYKLLRCNLQHKSAPSPYGISDIGFDSNSKIHITQNGKLIVGAMEFAKAFINGIDEIVNTKDQKVIAFIEKENYLKISK